MGLPFCCLNLKNLLFNVLLIILFLQLYIYLLKIIKIILAMKEVDKIDFLNVVIALLPDCFALEVKRFIACQFALESAFGTSAFAKCRNNYCGMKVPALRLTLATNLSERGEFAAFTGLTYCVHDYLLWLASNKFTKEQRYDLFDFTQHLKVSGYCPEADYITKIQLIYSKYYE